MKRANTQAPGMVTGASPFSNAESVTCRLQPTAQGIHNTEPTLTPCSMNILEGHVSLRLSVELWKQCSSVGGHVHLFLCLPPVADGAKSVTQHHVIHFRKGNMKCYRYFIVLED